jgi:predicted ATPase
LLTVFGPGGIGKSTIAYTVLDRVKGRYIDGGSLVSLEAVRDPGDVPAAIASGLAISLDARADPVDQLIAVLRQRRMLLVLDNAEHLTPAWVVFSQLLDACPNLEILITSRERLRLEHEWVYEISGLPDHDGVALFLETGRRVAPEVTVSDAEAQAICRAVGGSPLGLELAVPWLRVMTPDEIVSEIRCDVEVLSGGYRDGPVRHQSVTATMEHSWQLASDQQRLAVEALSVFAAPYTRELAEQVGGATSVVLRDLLDQSLVHRRQDGRYSSHPLVRGYAAARLAEDRHRRAEVRRRHAATILELVESGVVPSAHQAIIEDVIAAWAYAVESEAIDLIAPKVEQVTALMLAGGRINRGLQLLADASAVVEQATSENAIVTAVIKHAESRLLYFQGHHAVAARAAQEALRIATEAQDSALRVKASLALGWAQKWIAGDQAQYEAISPALPLAKGLGDPNLIAEVLNGLGCSASTLEKCRDHLRRGLDVVDSNSPDLRSRLLNNLGMVSWALGDAHTGIDHVRTAFDAAKSVDNNNGIVESLSSMAFIHADLGDLTIALQLAEEADSRTGASEFLKTRIYVRLVAGEVRRLVGDKNGARACAHDALTMAAAMSNEPFALRALRLQGQLLMDQGDIDAGLGVLAFVLTQTASKGGDFTSQILNPRAWEVAIRDVDHERIEEARTWAEARSLDDLIAANLSGQRRDVNHQRT